MPTTTREMVPDMSQTTEIINRMSERSFAEVAAGREFFGVHSPEARGAGSQSNLSVGRVSDVRFAIASKRDRNAGSIASTTMRSFNTVN